MADKFPHYHRLPGGNRFLTPAKLYLGSDHMLVVQRKAFFEDHWRFDLKDIQAFVVSRTRWQTVWHITWSVLLSLVILTNVRMWRFELSLLIIELVFAGLILWNHLLGPTCLLHIRTAVQQRRLPCVTRLRRAQKLLDALEPAIIAVQGQISPEELQERLTLPAWQPVAAEASPEIAAAAAAVSGISTSPPVAMPAPPPLAPAVPPLPIVEARQGGYHLWLGLALLGGGGVLFFFGMLPHTLGLIAAAVVVVSQMVLAILAMVKHGGGKLGSILTIIYAVLMNSALAIFIQLRNVPEARLDMFLPGMQSSVILGYTGGAVSVFIGIIVLISYARYTSRQSHLPTTPPHLPEAPPLP